MLVIGLKTKISLTHIGSQFALFQKEIYLVLSRFNDKWKQDWLSRIPETCPLGFEPTRK